MKAINIRTLQADDVEALLAFELENRDWFERHIDSRGSAFYSVQGITTHISAFLNGFATGNWHPFVIEDPQGRIIGRANLKDIDRAGFRAEVGYRIAEEACGQGLATRALEHLIRVAQTQWKLRELVASVYASNLGSAKVLERCGFTREALDREDGNLLDYRIDLVTQGIE